MDSTVKLRHGLNYEAHITMNSPSNLPLTYLLQCMRTFDSVNAKVVPPRRSLQFPVLS